MKFIILICLFPIFIFFFIFIYTWFRLRSRIYIHTSSNQSLFKKYPLLHKEVTLKTQDGEIIHSWYIPVNKPKAVLILVHGFTDKNGGKSLMLPHADYLIKNGYSVILPDLRSTGKSSGNKVFLGIKEWQDIESAYDYLKSLDENKNVKIGLFGISMGASTAIITVGKTGKGDFIIASVPFSDYDEQFRSEIKKTRLWKLPFFPFLQFAAKIEFGNYTQYNPLKMIVKIHRPIFIIAAKNDQDIDYHQQRNLYLSANEPKSIWTANTQHDVYDERPQEFQEKILSFLNSLSE
ncbi:alpha/beta hydrolase [Candidatus Roizmanbacteria bacterium]|nr:alpha/beta hydrolase [Candidatus Roizmanbacteria bacterium]